MNMVRSMLLEKQVPKKFWPEAVNWTTHMLNRSPTLAVKEMTPEEAWSGVKPNVNYFRVFGCIGHVHVPDNLTKKLDDKSFQCVLLGMSEESKAYRLYNPISGKIVTSRDVVFDENECWNWQGNNEVSVTDTLEWGDSYEEESERDYEEESEHDQNEDKEETTVGLPLCNTKANAEASSSSCNPPVREHSYSLAAHSTEVETAGSPVGRSTDDSPDNLHSSSIDDSPASRSRRVPFWMEDYVSGGEFTEEEAEQNLLLFTSLTDPVTFEEAVKYSKWRIAMKIEINAIERNETWELTDLPKGMKKIGVKRVFKTKLNENGEVDKCKARLVAKGYAQQHGIDYTEVFAPMARWDTIRMVIASAARHGWNVYQLNVKSAFCMAN